jgi:prepilin-type N-terminal cleavage/methylation domain-containing protein
MVMNNKLATKNRAFTFIELSVVILIIAILMFGTFSSSGVINNVKENITRDRMNVIYKALGDFLSQQKRLPCPASILVPRGGANYGKEVRQENYCRGLTEATPKGVYLSNINGQSSYDKVVFGMVPTNTLGLSEDFAEDAFGNKISYFIDEDFTYNFISEPDVDLSLPSFGTSNYKNTLYIKERRNNSENFINSDAIIVLVSGGANGFGAFKNNGIQNSRSVNSAEELENDVYNLSNDADGHFNKIFYSNFEDSENFDDIVLFKTRNDFVNNFDVMSLIPCKGKNILDTDFGVNKKSIYYGAGDLTAYNGCGLGNESIKKTIKCDSFGSWTGLIIACPGTTILQCNITGNGIVSKIVNANTSKDNELCNQQYFSGTYSWNCGSDGVADVINGCISYCNFAINGKNIKVKPGESITEDCASGYYGYYGLNCTIGGVAETANNCSANP